MQQSCFKTWCMQTMPSEAAMHYTLYARSGAILASKLLHTITFVDFFVRSPYTIHVSKIIIGHLNSGSNKTVTFPHCITKPTIYTHLSAKSDTNPRAPRTRRTSPKPKPQFRLLLPPANRSVRTYLGDRLIIWSSCQYPQTMCWRVLRSRTPQPTESACSR